MKFSKNIIIIESKFSEFVIRIGMRIQIPMKLFSCRAFRFQNKENYRIDHKFVGNYNGNKDEEKESYLHVVEETGRMVIS